MANNSFTRKRPTADPFAEMFGPAPQQTDNTGAEELPVSSLIPFKNHPFKVLDNEEMERLVESIKENGVLSPVIVRTAKEAHGKFEIISGHRRIHAAKRAGLSSVPAIVRDYDDDTAAILMVDSNLQREHILPSERAFAYKMRYEAMKHQGKKLQEESKRSDDKMAQETGVSARQIHRYIRLTNLIPDLLNMVDSGRIGIAQAETLSFLSEGSQKIVAAVLAGNTAAVINSGQAQKLLESEKSGNLTAQSAAAIMVPVKVKTKTFSFREDSLGQYFDPDTTKKEMEQTIWDLLDFWKENGRKVPGRADNG